MCFASSAGTLSPSIISAEAFCQPVNRGKVYVSPQFGINFIFEKACVKEADCDATSISEHKTILAQPPAVTPFTAATTGLGGGTYPHNDGTIQSQKELAKSGSIGSRRFCQVRTGGKSSARPRYIHGANVGATGAFIQLYLKQQGHFPDKRVKFFRTVKDVKSNLLIKGN